MIKPKPKITIDLSKQLTFDQVNELAKAYDAKQKASDFGSRVVVVQHQDGSYFTCQNAFAMKKGKWIVVFTEHCGFQVFALDDLESIRVFKPDYEKLKSL